jgi:hypothetical protein
MSPNPILISSSLLEISSRSSSILEGSTQFWPPVGIKFFYCGTERIHSPDRFHNGGHAYFVWALSAKEHSQERNCFLLDARMDSDGRPYGVRQSPRVYALRNPPSTVDRESILRHVRHPRFPENPCTQLGGRAEKISGSLSPLAAPYMGQTKSQSRGLAKVTQWHRNQFER